MGELAIEMAQLSYAEPKSPAAGELGPVTARRRNARAALPVALGALAALAAGGASAQSASPNQGQDRTSRDASGNVVSPVTVHGQHPRDFDPAKLEHIMPELAGTEITVTKKTTIIKLDQQPTVIDNNNRQLFNKFPGLLVTEQNTPAQFNYSYRGLGNPQESEYVLVLQDGLPISSNWIGFPTLYYQPLPQSVSEIQLIRGGNSLLYGPEPAPAVNFVMRRPAPGEAPNGFSENVGGSHGLYANFEALEGTHGAFEYRADFGYQSQDGWRRNAASRLAQGDLYLGWRPDASQRWSLELETYQLSAGDPGRISYAQYQADPAVSPTPYNHDWVDRYSVVLSHAHDFSGGLRLEAKAWYAYLDLDSRAAAALSPAAAAPASTTLQQELFRSEGLDLRLRQRWGQGDALTAGVVAYHSNDPFEQWTDADLYAGRDDHTGAVRLDQARSTDYEAAFVENLVRFGRFHVVMSARLDRETIKADEFVAPPTVKHPQLGIDDVRTIPVFALGFGNDFGRSNETYFNVSQGWRPLRYFDVASPFSDVEPGHDGDPTSSLTFETGVHGTPLPGLYYDVGGFWIDFRNRLETIAFADPNDPTAVVIVNTGDTRHRGVEAEVSYDVLAGRPGGRRLVAFGNVSLLDAVFTRSAIPGQVGKAPAFAPHTLVKGGLTWRKEKAYDLSLTGTYVSSQYWQDSDLPGPGAPPLPAKIPGYAVVDVAGDWYVTPRVRLIGGLSNLTDRRYYSRIFQSGIEPAQGRVVYAGLALGL